MPATIEGLLIVILIMSPGFLATIIAKKSVAYLDTSEIRFVIATVTVGILIHGLSYPWTMRFIAFYSEDRRSLLDHRLELFGWAAVTLFLLPISLGSLTGVVVNHKRVDRLLNRFEFDYVARTPSAWEYIINTDRGYYVRVYLKDSGNSQHETIVAGVFGKNSFAADDPRHGDMYLQTVWELDGEQNFVSARLDSAGVWIPRESISHIEFLHGEETSDEAET